MGKEAFVFACVYFGQRQLVGLNFIGVRVDVEHEFSRFVELADQLLNFVVSFVGVQDGVLADVLHVFVVRSLLVGHARGPHLLHGEEELIFLDFGDFPRVVSCFDFLDKDDEKLVGVLQLYFVFF